MVENTCLHLETLKSCTENKEVEMVTSEVTDQFPTRYAGHIIYFAHAHCKFRPNPNRQIAVLLSQQLNYKPTYRI